MPDTNYVSTLDDEQIEAALTAVSGLIVPANNGKVLAVESGRIVAKSVTAYDHAPVLDYLSVTENGDYTPEAGVDGFNAVHVAVPTDEPTAMAVEITENGTFRPSDYLVDYFSEVVVNVPTGVRDNIVENGYFGSGVVNQRGVSQPSVPEGGYGIDRWCGRSGTMQETVSSDGITFTAVGSSSTVAQYIEHPESLYGQTVTMSILHEDGLATGTATLSSTPPSAIGYVINLNSQIPNASFCRLGSLRDGGYMVQFGQTSGNSIKIKAVKLELGDVQTLAHMSGGQWVLNEIPNPTLELLKCQRFYLPLGDGSANRATAVSTNYIDWTVPIPVTMATTPELIGTPTVYNGSTAQTGFSFAIQSVQSNAITIRGTKTGHGLTDSARLSLADCAFSAEP